MLCTCVSVCVKEHSREALKATAKNHLILMSQNVSLLKGKIV